MVQVTALFSSDLVEKHAGRSIDLSWLGSFSVSNIVFEPNDAESNDSELERYYSAHVENEDLARELVAMLLQSTEVEAAWIRPPDAQPQ